MEENGNKIRDLEIAVASLQTQIPALLVSQGKIETVLEGLGAKIDILTVSAAEQRGSRGAERRAVAYVAGGISLIVSALGVIAAFFINGNS